MLLDSVRMLAIHFREKGDNRTIRQSQWAKPTPGLGCSCKCGWGNDTLYDITKSDFTELCVSLKNVAGRSSSCRWTCLISGEINDRTLTQNVKIQWSSQCCAIWDLSDALHVRDWAVGNTRTWNMLRLIPGNDVEGRRWIAELSRGLSVTVVFFFFRWYSSRPISSDSLLPLWVCTLSPSPPLPPCLAKMLTHPRPLVYQCNVSSCQAQYVFSLQQPTKLFFIWPLGCS